MGFNTSGNTITLTAKLTPSGRQRLVTTNNSLIAYFSLGDSDANYNAMIPLESGNIPSQSGDLGTGTLLSNSVFNDYKLKSSLIVNIDGSIRKSVEPQSINVINENEVNKNISINSSKISVHSVNRQDYNTDGLVNLFYSFGLPTTETEKNRITGQTATQGGFSDTVFNSLATDKILIFAIDNSEYGEVIDGKTIKFELPTTANTYTIYSTFQNKNEQPSISDNKFYSTTSMTDLGEKISLLVSDDIATPNTNPALSWSTGYGLDNPFGSNNKEFVRTSTNTNIGVTADTIVGISYLDKGLLVITNPQIINDYETGALTGMNMTYDSVSTSVSQIITCIANRGEFGSSTNKTFKINDTPRISEVGLYDNVGNLIAIAKTDRHVIKNINEFLALSIKINI